jgi:hypothetical protein
MPRRFTEAELADIGMASEMYEASPDGQEAYRRAIEDLPVGSMIIQLERDGAAE